MNGKTLFSEPILTINLHVYYYHIGCLLISAYKAQIKDLFCRITYQTP